MPHPTVLDAAVRCVVDTGVTLVRLLSVAHAVLVRRPLGLGAMSDMDLGA
jgi:hypothetical protein